ncbi:hypothetical protein [Aridibaculum aurantiacum]|uniref:hypothetical protein n=1 Tax=Aridibaculum aurantiacum TaxID=2810307 RepID=UPI001A95EDB5|nr:hypothetical protein [Aridibaculum aurantiacum]
MKKDISAALFGTAYLLVYVILFHYNAPLPILGIMFLLSPFLVIWMAYTILKHGKYEGRELAENEEWGYQDKPADFGKRTIQIYS